MKRVTLPADLRSWTLAAVRPGVESLLVAAVALGCAQAGWSLLTPKVAGASGGAGSAGDGAPSTEPALTAPTMETPFAPNALLTASSDYAVDSTVSTLSVVGVRMSADPARSGAILSVAGGEQIAYLVGDDIVPGVRLTAVQSSGIVLAIGGGERVVEMAGLGQASYADALLGRSAVPLEMAAPTVAAEAAAPAAPALPSDIPLGDAGPASAPPSVPSVATAQTISPEIAAWLAQTVATLAPATSENGSAGWVVAGEPPEPVRTAGLASGDVIVAVNGLGVDNAPAALAAAAGADVVLTVRRNGETLSVALPKVRT